jgi:hypothetical protein
MSFRRSEWISLEDINKRCKNRQNIYKNNYLLEEECVYCHHFVDVLPLDCAEQVFSWVSVT